MVDQTNYYVDHEGAAYRVTLHKSGRPLAAYRWALRATHGKPIKLAGRLGRKLVTAALRQRAISPEARDAG